MSQHDFTINDQLAAPALSDMNNALKALASNSSGGSAPTTTYANMHWYDTTSNILKQRSEADDAWINIGYFDQSTNTFKLIDNTVVVNTSGTQTGIIGDQATSVWQAGTGTTQSLVSPANVKSAITSMTPTNKAVAEAYTKYSNTVPTMVDGYGFSGVTNEGTGLTKYTFSTAQPDTNYIIYSHHQRVVEVDYRFTWWVYAKSTSSFTLKHTYFHGAGINLDHSVMVRRLT